MSRESDKVGRGREREQIRRSTKRVMEKADKSMDQEARDIATAALARSDAHEALCTERWKSQILAMARIEVTMKDVHDAIHDKIGKAPAGLIAALTGLIGFLAARAFPTH